MSQALLESAIRAFDEANSADPNREVVEQLKRATHGPGRHDVGVGVVVDPHGGGAGIGVMELVRADHAANFVTSALRVEARDARPEASDLEQHLGAVLAHEVAIAGREIILADVERDPGSRPTA